MCGSTTNTNTEQGVAQTVEVTLSQEQAAYLEANYIKDDSCPWATQGTGSILQQIRDTMVETSVRPTEDDIAEGLIFRFADDPDSTTRRVLMVNHFTGEALIGIGNNPWSAAVADFDEITSGVLVEASA